MRSEAIHGNKSQNARQKALDNFSRGRARVLVATDLASRGIDVTGVTHVINYELPADAESYVHRIGRTARAGASGIALSFCDGSERGQLKSIERLTNQRIAVVPTPANEDMPAAPPLRPRDERDARDKASVRASRQWSRSQAARQWLRPGRGGGGGHRPFGERSGGDRPSAPAEHQWSRGDYRDQPQGDVLKTIVRAPARQGEPDGARPHANRPYTPRPQGDRPFGGPPRGGRRFGGGGGGRGGRGRALKNSFLAEDFEALAKSALISGALFCYGLVVPLEEAALGLEADRPSSTFRCRTGGGPAALVRSGQMILATAQVVSQPECSFCTIGPAAA